MQTAFFAETQAGIRDLALKDLPHDQFIEKMMALLDANQGIDDNSVNFYQFFYLNSNIFYRKFSGFHRNHARNSDVAIKKQ